MNYNSTFVAFLLAFFITIPLSLFTRVILQVDLYNIFIVSTLSFASSYGIVFFALEKLIFREIHDLNLVVEKMKKKDFKFAKKLHKSGSLSPIKKLNDEIHEYASNKQDEIENLKKLELYRREFLADVSHELKTPLFSAQGFLHTLLDGAMEDENVRDKFLIKAAKSLDSLNTLVEDLLILSKMEAGVIKMNREHFDICELGKMIFDDLEPIAKEKNINFKFQCGLEGKSFVFADRVRIRHMLNNLVENAVKYGNKGGYVIINCRDLEDGTIQVSVEDNGRGIPKEHLDRIFERFYRVDKSRARVKGGSGIGLAIVKQIIDDHDTKISVKSKVKKGTIFKFTLPEGNPKLVLTEDEREDRLILQNIE